MPTRTFSSPADIRLLALDVDGVLTDGSIMLDDAGLETKRFNIRDGLGIVVLQKLNIPVAIITRRSGKVVEHRARELHIQHVVQGSRDKGAAIDELSRSTGIAPAHMAFMGDDWPDLPALEAVGLPVAVADADPRVKAAAAIVTTRPGGHGAVRELIEHILNAKGLLDQAVAIAARPAS